MTQISSGLEIATGDLLQRLQAAQVLCVPIAEEPARVRPAASEVERLCCDSQKLRRLTG